MTIDHLNLTLFYGKISLQKYLDNLLAFLKNVYWSISSNYSLLLVSSLHGNYTLTI